MSELPEEIRSDVITELYRQADDLNWELLSMTEKKHQYRRWIDDPAVGGRLRGFLDDHRIGTWIKDTPMKEYARAQEGFGTMARYALNQFPGPNDLVRKALGEPWTLVPGSVDEKPMHCTASANGEERYLCWGNPAKFRDLTWAALNNVVTAPIRPMIVVTLQDGIVLSKNERSRQQRIADHCGIDLRHIHRKLQPV